MENISVTASKKGKDPYRRTRFCYVLEAAFEYLINILLQGVYIAKVAGNIGMSDRAIGIVSALYTLGAGFQIFALFTVGREPVKRWVTAGHLINQLFFSLVWLTPVFRLSTGTKSVLFVVFLLAGLMIDRTINSPKINWLMASVDDRKRGAFTAKKETFSLISGMVFTYLMGRLMDFFDETGREQASYVTGFIAIVTLTVLHTLTLLLSREKRAEKKAEPGRVGVILKKLFANPNFCRTVLLLVMTQVVQSVYRPYYNTYLLGELGFSLTFISVLSIVQALLRGVISPLFAGKYADRTSFGHLFLACCMCELAGIVLLFFAVPSNGKVIYTIYFVVFEMLFQCGYGSSMLNLVYDSVDRSERMSAYAVSQAVQGVVGFGVTCLCGIFYEFVSSHAFSLFGRILYPQQALTALAALIMLCLVFWIRRSFLPGKNDIHHQKS